MNNYGKLIVDIENSNAIVRRTAFDYGMEIEKFVREVVKFARKYDGEPLERRTMLAIEDWKKERLSHER